MVSFQMRIVSECNRPKVNFLLNSIRQHKSRDSKVDKRPKTNFVQPSRRRRIAENFIMELGHNLH